jgi:nitroreductase
MSGIVFFKSRKLAGLREFYQNKVGCEVWLQQEDCIIMSHGNFLFGFCQRDEADTGGIITFFFDHKDEVDQAYAKHKEIAINKPSHSDKYRLYNFFARDPEGRMIEFQQFEHRVAHYLSGAELLLKRRSIREFTDEDVTDETIGQLLDNCRYAPTSMNSQSYYFKLIKDHRTIDWLSQTRGKSSSPIARGRLAVAICADPALSRRHVQDGCIAAYHFLLAAWSFGLGTCWIAAMDRDDVKEKLGIPVDHYVATVTPLGYPQDSFIKPPRKKDLSEFIVS